MTYIYIAIILLLAIYVTLISCFILSWSKMEEFKEQGISECTIYMSVIIAIKNEENNITTLLKSLKNQTLQSCRYEIILVNDHSTDNSLIIAQSFLDDLSNLHVINLKNGEKGKKAAIAYGISKAKGNLIVTTDADCIHNKKWLSGILSFYLSEKPKLIVAPVLMSHTNKFEEMQSLDFFSLMISGAAAIGLKSPIMCNGANLIFEKQVYYEFNDIHNSKYISGDDIFLLLNVKKKYKNDIKFLKSRHAIVTTKAEPTFSKYINQRTRWASKSKGYKDSFIIFVAFIVLFVHLSMLASMILSFYHPKMLLFLIIQLIVKSLIDFIFLNSSDKFFNINIKAIDLIITQLFNVFFIPYFAFKGLFINTKWK